MPSYYSIVQYVPNPLADERINVGVVAFDEDRVTCNVLHNWRRVSSFAGGTVDDVQSAVEQLLSGQLTPQDVRDAANSWSQTLRLTEPRGSLADVERLLAQVTAHALVDREPQRRPNTKLSVLRRGRLALERAVAVQLASAQVAVEAKYEIKGRRVAHEADLVVRNGKVLLIAQAISFARPPSRDVQRDVDAMAWFLEDLGQLKSIPPVAVLVAPPPQASREDYRDGISLFEELNASVVRQAQIDTWAPNAVESLVPALT